MTSSTAPRVITEIDGPVARVWLNRPDKLNGLDLDTVAQLAAAARSLRNNRTVRVVVIEGKGDSFCAGLDFAAAAKESKLRILRMALPNPLRGTNGFQECFWAWRKLPVPVIAITRGHVFGGGIQLALRLFSTLTVLTTSTFSRRACSRSCRMPRPSRCRTTVSIRFRRSTATSSRTTLMSKPVTSIISRGARYEQPRSYFAVPQTD